MEALAHVWSERFGRNQPKRTIEIMTAAQRRVSISAHLRPDIVDALDEVARKRHTTRSKLLEEIAETFVTGPEAER